MVAGASGADVKGVTSLQCRVVAVNGATIDFPVEMKGAGAAAAARVGTGNTPFTTVRRGRFLAGNLPNQLVFQVRSHTDEGYATATVFVEQDGMDGFPVAQGYCTNATLAPAHGAPATFGDLSETMLAAAADQRRCFLLTLKGEVSSFWMREINEQTRFEPLDALVWTSPRSSSPMAAALRAPPPYGAIPGVFFTIYGDKNAPDNPVATLVTYVDPARRLGVHLLEFTWLASRENPDQNAFGICAMRAWVGEGRP
jgi:hypothetical protein